MSLVYIRAYNILQIYLRDFPQFWLITAIKDWPKPFYLNIGTNFINSSSTTKLTYLRRNYFSNILRESQRKIARHVNICLFFHIKANPRIKICLKLQQNFINSACNLNVTLASCEIAWFEHVRSLTRAISIQCRWQLVNYISLVYHNMHLNAFIMKSAVYW